MLEIAVVSLDVGVEGLEALLTRDERERAARFVFERDRRRFIVARARLRQLLGARLGVAPESLEFVYNPQGKPALARPEGTRDLRFNLSHCEDVAVYAFADGAEVGIDVEAVRELDDADAIAARFFSPAEYEAYRGLPERERPQGFFNCWARKEAFIKALGSGLSHPLDSFDASSLAPGWTLRSFVPGPGLVGAVAVRTE